MSESKMYTLVSSDGQEFKVSQNIIDMSTTLVTLIGHVDGTEVIPIPDVDGKTLKYVVEFCLHYEDEPAYVPPVAGDVNNTVPDSDSWDMQFLFIDHGDLLKIVLAAAYLEIPRLTDATCYRMQLMIQGRPTEEIRTIFRIDNDFSEQEEEAIKRDHLWYGCPLPENPAFLRNLQ